MRLFCFNNVLYLICAFVIGSYFSTAAVHVSLAALLLLFSINRDHCLILSNSYFSSLPLKIFLLGSFFTFIFLMINQLLPQNEVDVIVFRFRKFLLEYFVAVAVYIFLRGVSFSDIKRVITFSFLLNIVFGLYQLAVSSDRISLLFPEPSSAGLYCCFYIFVMFAENEIFFYRVVTGIMFIMSFLVASKAQLIVYLIYFFLRYRNRILTILLLFSSIVFLMSLYFDFLYEKYDYFHSLINFIFSFNDMGMNSLSIDNGVYGTFTVRLSSIYTAVYFFITHPIGIGFGAFNSVFESSIKDLYFYENLRSDELDDIVGGIKLATPKSLLLEILLSTGWLGLIYLIKAFYKIRFHNLSANLILAVIAFYIISTIVELNNFYLYLYMISLFIEKKNEVENV